MSSTKVTLDSKLTIVSSKPVSPGTSHTLSAIDHAMGYHTIHIIFYYMNDEDNLFGSFELGPLRESLCEVLSLYPMMTGRLARGVNGNWEVRFNDAGVRVIKANVDTTLIEWLSSPSASDESLLVVWDDMPHDPTIWSPFRIQINKFKEGGLAIGLSCSHMLADLTFIASFFKSWTETYRNLQITNPPFITQITSNGNAESFTPYQTTTTLSSQKTTSSRKMATTTFKFPSSIIKLCLSKVHQTCPNATPFDFLSALFWSRIAHLKKTSKSENQTRSLSICTDFRSLVKPSLPIGYFGNALHFSTLSVKVQDMESVQEIANIVHKHLEELEEEEILCSLEWFDSQKESPKCMYGSELTCVCMENMMKETESLLYAAMFGKSEKAAHVSCRVGNVDGEGLIMVMPSSEGGFARTVMVMLPEEELDKLSNDNSILNLEPTIMLAACGVLEH